MDFYDYDSNSDKSFKIKLYVGIAIFVIISVILVVRANTTSNNKTSDKPIASSTNDTNSTKVPLDGLSSKIILTGDQKDETDEDSESNEDATTKPSSKPTKNTTDAPTKNATKNPSITTKSPTVTSKPISTPTPTTAPALVATLQPSPGNSGSSSGSITNITLNNPGVLRCDFVGTPNAFLYGYLKWTDSSGNAKSQYWNTFLSSSGYSTIRLELTPDVHKYSFQISKITLDGVSSSALSADVTLTNER